MGYWPFEIMKLFHTSSSNGCVQRGCPVPITHNATIYFLRATLFLKKKIVLFFFALN
jgi:hypothetical protein